jgi:uracil-DNA glycosylase
MEKGPWLTQMQQGWSTCQGCRLSQTRKSVVFGYGNPDAQVLVIGEAPGANEDMAGVPFVGAAGQLLDQYLGSASVDYRLMQMAEHGDFPEQETRDILLHTTFYTNVVSCRPPENRDPARDEIATCRTRLLEIIYTVDPVILIAVGRVSLEAMLGKNTQITRERGEVFDVRIPGRAGTPVTYPCLALLHPAYLLRLNDFTKEGGMSDSTYFDVLKAMHIIDWFKWLHFGIQRPAGRPSLDNKKEAKK